MTLTLLRLLLSTTALLLALPVVAVLGSWAVMDAASWAVLRHQASTVLPTYALESAVLLLGVALGAALLGVGSAVAVALFRFPGRRVLAWALLLPMAMPAYVLAYAYTDALQFSGPLQVALRERLQLPGALWPEVRSLGGAVAIFSLALYPYVYLLTRAALGGQAVRQMEAARLLGAGLARRILTVALPLARPAVMAGVALVMMETLADYGVGAYFGLATLTTGIYRAWLSMNDAAAAAQLASVLLVWVSLLLLVERRAQSRQRFASSRAAASSEASAAHRLSGLAAATALLMCLLPVLLGFVLPVLWLGAMLLQDAAAQSSSAELLPRFAGWAGASVRLAALAAVLATGLALLLGLLRRLPAPNWQHRLLAASARLLGLGYAVPGAVVAIGLLLPVAWLQASWPQSQAAALLTGSALGLLLAYLLRFSSVALQSIQAGYAQLPLTLDETSRLLGAGPMQLWRQVHWPVLRRSAAAAALLVFVDTMKELPATLVLRPFGSDTLAVVAYNLARDERLVEAALPSLVIVAVGLLPVLLLSRVGQR